MMNVLGGPTSSTREDGATFTSKVIIANQIKQQFPEDAESSRLLRDLDADRAER